MWVKKKSRKRTNVFLPTHFFVLSCSFLIFFLTLSLQNQADMQLIMQKLLAMAVSTVMTKLMMVFKVSFFMALIF